MIICILSMYLPTLLMTRRPFLMGSILSSANHRPKLKNKTTSLEYNTQIYYSEDDDDDGALLAQTPSARQIRYYGPIDSKSLLSLNSVLCNLASESNEPIHLHIQSGGGELIPALYTSDLIASLQPEVHTYVDGVCASAATLLSIAGNVRHMSKNSIYLIHQLSTTHSGKYSELQQSLQNSDLLMRNMMNIYLEHSKLNVNQLKQLLSRDAYINAQICLKYGLIDFID